MVKNPKNPRWGWLVKPLGMVLVMDYGDMQGMVLKSTMASMHQIFGLDK